ncbi:MAG: hypothetical protein HY927_05020 [Elusimicrobia bacterium]|nr:hypothetical protein [Elusimicrobiota bacterium]
MPRAFLAALVALSLPAGAGAAPKRKTVTVPKTTAASKQAFEQTFDLVFVQAGQSFLKDEEMPDPSALDPFVESLKEPELSKARADKARIEKLIANAECVQQGSPRLFGDAYKPMVDQAADDLEVGLIVEQNFVPNGRAGRSLDNDEKVLVRDCQAEARNERSPRRAVYQRCLGRRRAEQTYLDPGRSDAESLPDGQNPACVRVLQVVAANGSKFPASLSQDVDKKLQEMQARLSKSSLGGFAGSIVPDPLDAAFGDSKPYRKKTPSATDGKLLPSHGTGFKTTQPPLNAADLAASAKLAGIVKSDEIGFTGYCYSYVKSALQKVGLVDRDSIANAGAGAHAKQFAAFVEKNPALLKRKLRRIPAPSWPLPIGTIVVWSPGACRYSLQSGHIEIVTRIRPPQACSDGCGTFQVACLEEYSSDPAQAAEDLPEAKDRLQKAQAAWDAVKDSKDVKARRAAAAALKQAKAAVAGLEGRLEPKVAAYVIERPDLP